jgi:hypothetical protein
MSNNYFTDKDIYIKSLIIEKNNNYSHNYSFLKNKKLITKLDFSLNNPNSLMITQREWNVILLTKIQQISAKLHVKSLNGGIKWIFCSPNISNIFIDFDGFHYSTGYEHVNEFYCLKIGVLYSRYNVYQIEKMSNDLIFCANDNFFGLIEIKNC